MRYRVLWSTVLVCLTASSPFAVAQTASDDSSSSPTFLDRLNQFGRGIFGVRGASSQNPQPAPQTSNGPTGEPGMAWPTSSPPADGYYVVPGTAPPTAGNPTILDANGQVMTALTPPPRGVVPDPDTDATLPKEESPQRPILSRLAAIRDSIFGKSSPPPAARPNGGMPAFPDGTVTECGSSGLSSRRPCTGASSRRP